MLELLFNIVAGLEDCNCFTKRFQHKCFLGNIVKFLRTAASALLIIKLIIINIGQLLTSS